MEDENIRTLQMVKQGLKSVNTALFDMILVIERLEKENKKKYQKTSVKLTETQENILPLQHKNSEDKFGFRKLKGEL